MGSNMIKPVADEGMSDDRFIQRCQFASDLELPAKEVKTLPLLYILYCDHDITAGNGAGAGLTLLFPVNGTSFRFRYNEGLVAAVMKISCEPRLNVPTIVKYDDPWLSHASSFGIFNRQLINVTNSSRDNVHDNP
jgi:hypothetical protein